MVVPPKNVLLVAAAGAGKTTHLVKEALRHLTDSILITTYTDANELEIRKRFVELNGCVPPHVTLLTWFSFLIQHGVKPFESLVLDVDTCGLAFVQCASAQGIPEVQARRFYLSLDRRIYSDKLAKLAVRCDERSGGRVVRRIGRVFSQIYVDEVQDLAGYDLSMLQRLFGSEARVLLVGDPRQVLYLTHHESKFRKYQGGRIVEFVKQECRGLNVSTDQTSLTVSHRCNTAICKVADQLHPSLASTRSGQHTVTGHDGLFLVKRRHLVRYVEMFLPTQLRLNRGVEVSERCPVYTFGDSKGLGFDRVLVYPTKDMAKWLVNRTTSLKDGTRARLYVALTRARHSVGVVCDERANLPADLSEWNPDGTSDGKGEH